MGSSTLAVPKRPSRPSASRSGDVSDKDEDGSFFETPEKVKSKDNEQEIDFGTFSWYGDDDDTNVDSPIEIIEPETRKRPQRPIFSGSGNSDNNPSSFGPFDFDNVEQFMPQNAKRPTFTFGSSYDHDGHDDDHDESGLETLTYKVLDTKYNYEIREYPASKWVCTEEVKNVDEDPYENWRSRFDNDGRRAMMQISAEEKRKGEKKGMFMKLFKYILGVNIEATEIEMTTPVTTKRTKMALNREKHQMCFWTGSEWEDKELPKPIKDDVYFETRKPMQVFVKKFSGYALSMAEWNEKLIELSNNIKDRKDVETPETHFTISYSSPFVEENKRRNEVWIKRDPTMTMANAQKFGGFSSVSLPSKFTSADELTELLEHNTIDKGDDYEVRVYPASKWACTKEYDIDPIKDPMNDWQDNFNNNPFLAMSSSEWKDLPMNKMFKTLYRYIIGLNDDNIEIDMTRPVINKMIPQRRTRKYDEEMCFWLGSEYDRKDPPIPLNSKVSIKELDEMTVYVREYGGFSLSHEDIAKEYNQLKFDLLGKVYDDSVFYSVGYNSPFTMENRRNEIWIQAV